MTNDTELCYFCEAKNRRICPHGPLAKRNQPSSLQKRIANLEQALQYQSNLFFNALTHESADRAEAGIYAIERALERLRSQQ